jgi:hypothetical protein
MRDGPIAGRFSAAEVEERLTDAGRVLLALPWSGCFPAGFRNLWPDQGRASTRRRVPTAQQISAMDAAYGWTAFIIDQDERRFVLMRSLVLSEAGAKPRHVWTWRRMQRLTGLHRDTLKVRWGRGIDRIVRGLNRPAVAIGAHRPPFGPFRSLNHGKPELAGDMPGHKPLRSPIRVEGVL